MGAATTHFLAPLIRLFAFKRGLLLDIYESDFGLYEQEIWSEAPALKAFAPDIIHFHLSSRILQAPAPGADPADAAQLAARRWLALFAAAAERFGCPIIANNFETVVERPCASLDAVSAASRNGMIRAINAAIAAELPARVHIHDVEQLSAVLGKKRWFDARAWNESKIALGLDCHPHYADRLAATVGAAFGRSKKCLVLDLDNTLWGGVIGDDGLHGIKLGQGQPEGEAFEQFQSYVKALKLRGVLLAVASKNEPENALAPFREHRDMILKESDIASFVASWEPKDGSIRTIAKRLNIGLDAIVFFDDNPAERRIVAANLPDVTVIDVPEDPSLYVQALDDANLFDTLGVTLEDQIRGDFFQQNQAREELVASSGSYDDFLRGLEMRAVAEPIHAGNVGRVSQLINKTNQFNLTTLRMSEAEVQALIDAPDAYTSTVRLDDRFGSNGLISVVIGRSEAGVLTITNWLMSCRVLKRGVEVLEMERLLNYCRERGLGAVIGRYLPTEKNKLVANHYADLGFVEVAADGAASTWRFDVDERHLELKHFIGVS
jgi:FkbH-like protein